MTRFFPKKNKRNFVSDSGVNLVASIVNDELGWIFRKNNNETDFGIDGYIDIATDEGEVTGQSFAVQIKAGSSYFRRKTANGYVYDGELKHLNYYRNHQLPILIIICLPEEQICLFTLFDEAAVESTASGWKLNIKDKNIFGHESKTSLLGFLPPLKENIDDLKEHWAFNNTLESSGALLYIVDRDDVQKGEVKYFIQFIERLCVNDSLCQKVQGKVEITIDGYNHDSRELYEIYDVKRWFRKADRKNIPWFYFCSTIYPSFGLKMYLLCMSNAKVIDSRARLTGFQALGERQKTGMHPKIKVTFNPKIFQTVMDNNWMRLNMMTEELGLSIDFNEEILRRILKCIFPEDGNENYKIFYR